jgi:hypothetical protein
MESRTLRLRIESADETVRRAVAGLMRLRGFTAQRVADAVGIPLGTLERRLDASGSSYAFTAGEVLALTDFFGIESGTLFNYMDGQYRPPHGWTPARPNRVPAPPASIEPVADPCPDADALDAVHARLDGEMAIGRAQGVLMQAQRTTGAEALARMRTFAHRHGVTLLDVATIIIVRGNLPDVPHRA